MTFSLGDTLQEFFMHISVDDAYGLEKRCGKR